MATQFTTIAHRGASAYAPENTFAAFDKALALGTTHVELDVHFSRDGHVVVIHDDTVDRTTDGSGRVASLPLVQLRALDAGSWFDPRFAGECIPSLGGVLGRYKDRLHFHIEIKAVAEGLSQRTADLVQGYGVVDSVTVISFQEVRLAELRGYAPELPAGWLTSKVDNSIVARAREMGVTEICPRADALTPELVADLHAGGFAVRAWGVGDEEEMRRVVDCGVDGMTIDFPDKLTEYLKVRVP